MIAIYWEQIAWIIIILCTFLLLPKNSFFSSPDCLSYLTQSFPKIYFSHRRPSLFAGEWEQRTTAARHLEAGPFIIHMACLSSDISNSGCFVNDLTCFWPWLFSLWKGNLNRAPKAGNTDDFHGQQHGTWEVTMETFKSNRRGLERGSISMKKYCSRQHYLLFLLFF